MIKIICLGKLKENYLSDFVNDYLNRIKKYHKIELIELKDEENLENEAKNILKYIGNGDFVITLEIMGKSIDSLEFAYLIEKTFITNSTITFVIGSSTGLSDRIKKRSNYALSFSKLTYPHGLFRGILLEQIYRAFKINNNESYHK
jgi:23S rRNA (pseudouridine1915-N3)-methyltransferase